HIAPPIRHAHQGAEVARRDRLSDRKGVVAGWHRDLHPVEEHTGVDLADHPVLNAILHAAEGLGGALREIATSRARGSDLTHPSRSPGRCSCWRRSRRRRGNVAVNQSVALEYGAGEAIEETGRIFSAIGRNETGACAVFARNQSVASQPCEVGRKILVDPVRRTIECYRLEGGAGRGIAEGAQRVRNDVDAFRTAPLEDTQSNGAS